MAFRDVQGRRPEQARERQLQSKRARFAAAGSLAAVTLVTLVIVLASTIGSGSPTSPSATTGPGARASRPSRTATSSHAGVPILAYNVINSAPPQTTAPASLYVPASDFSAQMTALKADGWRAITLDELEANWSRGAPLGRGRPIVITFDRGYASQYTNALPVLQRLGWVGVENLQADGLSPADGGLSDAQVRGLVTAGWELDTQGLSQPDLTALDPTQLASEIGSARQTVSGRYGAPVNWFSYPSGSYDPTVVAAVRAAGFSGATTTVPGGASPQSSRFRLPRLEVLGGTSPSSLLSQIAAAQGDVAPPAAFHATGT